MHKSLKTYTKKLFNLNINNIRHDFRGKPRLCVRFANFVEIQSRSSDQPLKSCF